MDKIKCLVNMIIARCINVFYKNKFKNRKIWLVGGNAGELYVDNGKAIYEFLSTKNDIEKYWILNKNNKLENKISNTLTKGSVKSYLYFMNAEVALFSHSISADIVPYLFVVPFMKKFHNKILKVFLNHGTVGFKVNKPLHAATTKLAESLVKSYDINICDSQFERDVKVNSWWGVPSNSAFITGYPRYDFLENKCENNKEILFMPTWRPWINAENQKIEKTEYFKNIVNLISNETLNNFLEKNNIKFNIYIHQLMHKYLQNFENINLGKNVTLLEKESDISYELMKSNLLITDYSSVAYDYLFLNKPIIFYQFDKDEYEKKIGSYVDLNKDLFGEGVYNIDQCINKIIEISNNKFNYIGNINEKINDLRNKFLYYKDKENNERIYKLILKKLEEKR